MKQKNTQAPFAEIIESSLDHFLAQSWEHSIFPTFGSLVCAKNKEFTALALVTQIETGSQDPMRYPFPYKKTEDELLAEQPQIFEFLKTTFRCQIVGYEQRGIIYYTLPPKPCQIHTFVAGAENEQTARFFSQPDFLSLLFAFEGKIPSLDELLLALLSNLQKGGGKLPKTIDAMCRHLSLLTGNDYRRLKLFLRRAERIVKSTL